MYLYSLIISVVITQYHVTKQINVPYLHNHNLHTFPHTIPFNIVHAHNKGLLTNVLCAHTIV